MKDYSELEAIENTIDEVSKKTVEDMNEGLRELARSAFEAGYQQGREDGLNELWDALDDLILLSSREMEAAFGTEYYTTLEVHDFLDKLRDYMTKYMGEIKLFDEVEWCDENWIVTAIDGSNRRYCIMNKRGTSQYVSDSLDFRKTGNNYPQMADVLQQLGGTI